jgi:hypothetical protein
MAVLELVFFLESSIWVDSICTICLFLSSIRFSSLCHMRMLRVCSSTFPGLTSSPPVRVFHSIGRLGFKPYRVQPEQVERHSSLR